MRGALTTSEPLSRAYDSWADTYDEEYASRPETASEDALVVSWLRDRLPAGSSLIDAGCGTGWLLDRLGERGQVRAGSRAGEDRRGEAR